MAKKAKQPKKKAPARGELGRVAPAEPYTVLVYRVNALIQVAIPAGTPPEDGRRQALEQVLDGVKMQEGGPKLFFGEPKGSAVAVVERDALEGGRFRP